MMKYKIGKPRRVTVNHCPTCKGTLNGETSIALGAEEARSANEGDLGFCWNCGQLLRLDAALKPVKAEPSQVEEMEPAARNVLLAMSRERRAKWLAQIWRNN